jgi:hypothetical protein
MSTPQPGPLDWTDVRWAIRGGGLAPAVGDEVEKVRQIRISEIDEDGQEVVVLTVAGDVRATVTTGVVEPEDLNPRGLFLDRYTVDVHLEGTSWSFSPPTA